LTLFFQSTPHDDEQRKQAKLYYSVKPDSKMIENRCGAPTAAAAPQWY